MKVINWLFGSFFRTIGRTIAILLMGGLLYYILASNGVGISDLFLDNLKASTFQTYNHTMYFGVSQNEIPYNNDYDMYIVNVSDTTDSVFYFSFTKNALVDPTQGPTISKGTNYAYFRGYINAPGLNEADIECTSTTSDGCDTWNINNKFTFSLQMGQYAGNNYYPASSCYLTQYALDHYENGLSFIAKCPIFDITQRLQYVRFNWNRDLNQKDIRMGLYMEYIEKDTGTAIVEQQQQTNEAITNQTQQQQQQHQEMMNSTTTEAEDEGSSFFGNFTTEDHGGLNSIITAPLNTIRSLLSSSCTKLTLPLPYVNKNLELPCMNDIYTEHFGLFFSLYQTIILAIISYRCLRSIFFDITGFTNPEDDRIEVMDL